MTTTTPTPTSRGSSPTVGERRELGRYATPADGQRALYGQRINGSVRFLPDQPVVLEPPSSDSEDRGCRPRGSVEEEHARTPYDRNDRTAAAAGDTASPRRRTGARVELARYAVSGGERVLYGQRVFGVVRVTDVPSVPVGRAYLVERGLEEEGAGANAALQALIADYLRQARWLDAVPMARHRW